jgi:hypothetical protein
MSSTRGLGVPGWCGLMGVYLDYELLDVFTSSLTTLYNCIGNSTPLTGVSSGKNWVFCSLLSLLLLNE